MQKQNKIKTQKSASSQYNLFLIQANKNQKIGLFSMVTTAAHLKKLFNI